MATGRTSRPAGTGVIRSASARTSTVTEIRSNGSSTGSSIVGVLRRAMTNTPPTSSPSSSSLPSGYGCVFMSPRPRWFVHLANQLGDDSRRLLSNTADQALQEAQQLAVRETNRTAREKCPPSRTGVVRAFLPGQPFFRVPCRARGRGIVPPFPSLASGRCNPASCTSISGKHHHRIILVPELRLCRVQSKRVPAGHRSRRTTPRRSRGRLPPRPNAGVQFVSCACLADDCPDKADGAHSGCNRSQNAMGRILYDCAVPRAQPRACVPHGAPNPVWVCRVRPGRH